MIEQIQLVVISKNNLWIILKIGNKHEMKRIKIYGTLKEICPANSKYNNKTSSDYTVKYSQEQQQQLHQLPPMDHNENQQYFYKRKYDADDEDDDNKLLDKENAHDNYIKIYNGDNSKNKIKNNYNNVDHDDDDYDDHNVHIEVETKNCSDKFLENNANISTRPCLDGNQQNQALFSTFNYQNESSLEPVNKIRETSTFNVYSK